MADDPRLAQAKAVHAYLYPQAKADIFRPPVTEIEPGLYLGGRPTPQFPKVDGVLNVSDKHWNEPEVGVLTDNTTADAMFWMPIHDREPFPGITWLDIATDIIQKCIDAGWSVLVHCDAGMSRSAMVMVAYFMKRDGLSADDALDKVLEKRSIAPNPYFLVGLEDWENYLKTGQDTSKQTDVPAYTGQPQAPTYPTK